MGRLGGGILFVMMMIASPILASSLLSQAAVKWFSVGNSAVAESIGVEAMGINPAGLIGKGRQTMISGYSSEFQNAFFSGMLGTSFELTHDVSVGLIGALRKMDDIPETVGQGNVGQITGSFSDSEIVGRLGAACRVAPGLVVGASAGVYHHVILNDSALQSTVDLGFSMDAKFAKFGASLLNVGQSQVRWTTGRVENRPMQLAIGVSAPLENGTLMASVSQSDSTLGVNLGAVYPVLEHLSVSAGVQDVFTSWTAAVGLDLQLDQIGIIYTYAHHPDLGETHKFGVEFAL